MHPMNERVLRASAKAHGRQAFRSARTPTRRTRPARSAARLQGGGRRSRPCGHWPLRRFGRLRYLERLIQNGSYCGMDRIGLQQPRTSEQRADMVAKLVEKGTPPDHALARRILFHRHDPAGYRRGSCRSGTTRTSRWMCSMLRERGVSEAAITQMTVGNPRQIFEQNSRTDVGHGSPTSVPHQDALEG